LSVPAWPETAHRPIIGRLRAFTPRLSGARAFDRVLASGGALVGIGLTGLLCAVIEHHNLDVTLPLLAAPVGASSVLLFAVPASPMAQPWAIVGGNTISALVGVAVARLIGDPVVAAGVAVALAIAAMSLARCLHPPGGAAALTAVLGGTAVTSAGFTFAFVPMGLNCLVLVGLGWLFHRWSGHSYPHRAVPVAASTHGTTDRPAQVRVGFQAEDIEGALGDFGETYDIAQEDLDRLMRRVETRAFERMHGDVRCGDIMSRDVVHIDGQAGTDIALALLLDHDVRILPVVDQDGRVVGVVGLRQMARRGGTVSQLMTEAVTGFADQPASHLIEPLSDGRHHAVVIVDREQRLAGIITQTDLLAALMRSMLVSVGASTRMERG
jgi:CBS domain-containing membrane protein